MKCNSAKPSPAAATHGKAQEAFSRAAAHIEPTALPALDGYVTSVTAKTDFAFDGIHVVCGAKTRYRIGNDLGSTSIPWTNGLYIGQPLKLFGKKDHKAHTLIAKEIVLQYESDSAKAGSGMIDRVVPSETAPFHQRPSLRTGQVTSSD